MRLADGRGRVVDVRADDQVDDAAAESFEAMEQACRAVGWEFVRVGPPDPGGDRRRRDHYRRPRRPSFWPRRDRDRRAGTAPADQRTDPASTSCLLNYSTASAGAPPVHASGRRSYGQVLLELPVAELPGRSGCAQ
ncbi:hypothetical protein DKG34_25175 [Streptomyces sp. NWU49]|nr:hypothetical protein DKG34_25175 [Streptomyces sp. NWU49]